MPVFGSVEHLIELAIQSERLTETFYRRLARKFSEYPPVEQFWNNYAAEENGHARWLEGLRGRLDADRLAEPADPQALEQAEQAARIPLDPILDGIKNLQDAYEAANELEHAETNAVFELLIGYFPGDPQTQAFLRAQLNEHVGRLMIDFPTRLGTGTLRRGIEAGEG